jgi:orotidine-5'-phosphate decarboxylase
MDRRKALAEKVIIALDVATRREALALVDQVDSGLVYKIGMELFTAEGPPLLEAIAGREKKVFLDLKYHDIPNTVAGAVRSAARHGVFMLTLHASGGKEMMAKAAVAAVEESEKAGTAKPLLLGVTVLTSLKDKELRDVGCASSVAEQVLRLAGLAGAAGLDGVVCSPHEIEIIRKEFGRRLLIVTPGIRPAWTAAQDQKRIMTPAEALGLRTDYLVIGRPVTAAPSPKQAFERIIDELIQTSAAE